MYAGSDSCCVVFSHRAPGVGSGNRAYYLLLRTVRPRAYCLFWRVREPEYRWHQLWNLRELVRWRSAMHKRQMRVSSRNRAFLRRWVFPATMPYLSCATADPGPQLSFQTA